MKVASLTQGASKKPAR